MGEPRSGTGRRTRRPARVRRAWRVRIRAIGRRGRRLGRSSARALQAALATARLTLARLATLGRRALRAALVLGAIAAISLAVGALAATAYGHFGYFPGRNADAWASRAPEFVGTASCAGCHAAEAGRWAAAPHSGVSCESCHGPLAGHPGATPAVTALATPAAPGVSDAGVPLIGIDEGSSIGLPATGSSALCLTCHQAVIGRPGSFPTIDPEVHFAGAPCTACHDAHTTVAPAPPDVLHPLAGLPDCTFCHGSAGLRPVPASHPSWAGDCFTCHRRPAPPEGR
jgi:hypothetical protein